MEWIEVTNPVAPDYGRRWVDDEDWRPDQTLADWIARGNPVGEIEVTEMAMIKNLGGETCPRKSCYLCSTDETHVREFAQSRREVYAENLVEYEVEWDPTLNF